MRYIIFLTLTSIFMFASVGKVTSFKGSVFVIRDGVNIDVNIGFLLEKSDKIVTKDNSKALILFDDNTSITVGKNSKLDIFEFVLDEVEPKNSKASFGFGNGLFRTITGKVGKLNRDKFKIKTKSASIGIRGTIFDVFVSNKFEKVGVVDGAIYYLDSITLKKFSVDSGYKLINNTSLTEIDISKGRLIEVIDKESISKESTNENSNDNTVSKDKTELEETKAEDEIKSDNSIQPIVNPILVEVLKPIPEIKSVTQEQDRVVSIELDSDINKKVEESIDEIESNQDVVDEVIDDEVIDDDIENSNDDTNIDNPVVDDETEQEVPVDDNIVDDGETDIDTDITQDDSDDSQEVAPPVVVVPVVPVVVPPIINVEPQNSNPYFTDLALSYSLDEDSSKEIFLNAIDNDGDDLTYSITNSSSQADISIDENKIVYTPNLNYNGTDSIEIEVKDGKGGVDKTLITIYVDSINDSPILELSSITSSIKQAKSISFEYVLSDVDSQASIISVSSASNSLVSYDNGVINYTPNDTFVGEDTITITYGDEVINDLTKSIVINVEPIDKPNSDILESDSVVGNFDDILKEDSREQDAIMSSSDLSFGYWLDGSGVREDLFINGIKTNIEVVKSLYINSNQKASYSGDIASIVTNDTGDRVDSGGNINLNLDFGSKSLDGDITIDSGNWKANINSGSLDEYGFSSNNIESHIDSSIDDITGQMSGKYYGNDIGLVGGKINLNSIKSGSVEAVFGANRVSQ